MKAKEFDERIENEDLFDLVEVEEVSIKEIVKISFSNRISPSGLVPRFPNSLKPFSIVSVGIIVWAKTIGKSLHNKITSLFFIFFDSVLINFLSSIDILESLSWIKLSWKLPVFLILFVIGPFSKSQEVMISLWTLSFIELKEPHDDNCFSCIK